MSWEWTKERGLAMTYRIVGVDDYNIVIEFRKDNKEITFKSYDEAEKYKQLITKEAIIPSKYKLTIKE
ncbi:hypothetical protein HBHAL_4620 [Halobacillus halophilus DSM 2266]|uniref:Uncharacterized protein n=2 Tax=Bacillaceae TaxID=186817 RepID=I0JS37_HALH3|nr:hypothetical protein HBHAL_4620 [Halobacillus halophilus DSM 2266]